MDPARAGLVVVLVHGTRPRVFGRELFAPPAWTRVGSPFQTRLAAGLRQKALFDEFTWSGANTHAARVSSGERLAARLRELRKEHPTSRLAVVAHSHGGNVAMYAMRQLAPASQVEPHPVDALVCLGTPFFHAVLRDLGVVVRRFWISVYYGIFLGLIASFVAFGPLLALISIPLTRVFIVVVAAAFIVWRIWGVRLMDRFVTADRISALAARARDLAARVDSTPAANGPRLLLVKSARDEAKLWLMLADRAASRLSGEGFLRMTSQMLFKSVDALGWLQARSRWVVAPAMVVLGLILKEISSKDWKNVQLKGMIFFPFVLVIGLTIIHSIVFIAMMFTVRGSSVTFGQSLFLSLVATVTTTDRPPGEGEIEYDVLPVALPRAVFHHGAFYVDPPIIDSVAAWVDRASLLAH